MELFGIAFLLILAGLGAILGFKVQGYAGFVLIVIAGCLCVFLGTALYTEGLEKQVGEIYNLDDANNVVSMDYNYTKVSASEDFGINASAMILFAVGVFLLLMLFLVRKET